MTDDGRFAGERVLLTGGAGFIGSHLAERLLAEGARVLCLDSFDPFYSPAIKRGNVADALEHESYRLIEGDIADDAALDEAFALRPTVLLHFAALAGVRPSIEAPARYLRVNVEGTGRLLQRCVEHGVGRVVFASSSSVYGNRKRVPFRETDPVDDPVSPYAASKKAGELLASTYHALYGLPVTCLRLFTVYGPRQRPEMAIHKFVRDILAGRPVTLYGDGSSSRDYTYLDDIVDGTLSAVERPLGYEIVNLGGASPVSLAELVALIEEATGQRAKRQFLPDQKGDVERTFASLDKAADLLGYHPQTSLEQGLARFLGWYLEAQPPPPAPTPCAP
jgi:UDP-glucuronate 4-epimerase